MAWLEYDETFELDRAVELLRQFPFHDSPYDARNWGHSLHWLCSYPSRLKPSIASWLIRLFTKRGDLVIDPFAGIGTVPFEAALQGRLAVAGDLSPAAAIVSRAKLAPPTLGERSQLLDELRVQLSRESLSLETTDPEIATFYHEQTFREILVAREFLQKSRLQRRPAADFLTAGMLHILHGNRPYALSRRSHNIIPIPPKGPAEYKPVSKHLDAKLRRHTEPVPAAFVEGSAYEMPAKDLEAVTGNADAVITSPPFLGTTEFVRQNRVRLWFSGWDYATQEGRKPDFFEHRRDRDEALFEIARIVAGLLRPGGLAVLHVGVVGKYDMASRLRENLPTGLMHLETIYEDARHLESHGRTDRGATATHAYAIFRKVS